MDAREVMILITGAHKAFALYKVCIVFKMYDNRSLLILIFMVLILIDDNFE